MGSTYFVAACHCPDPQYRCGESEFSERSRHVGIAIGRISGFNLDSQSSHFITTIMAVVVFLELKPGAL